MRRLRLAVAGLSVVVLAASFAAVATADDDDGSDGFRTNAASMLNCSLCDRNVPVLTVGEDIPGTGYQFEAIPDGISISAGGADDDSDDLRRDDEDDDDDGDRRRSFDLYVNHETSTVPFPFTFPGSTDQHRNQNDFDNSQVSRLTVNQDLEMTRGRFVIPSSAGFQRFCSNYLATEKEGFSRPILFTNEEAIDWVKRTGKSFPATVGAADSRQAGAVVAYDIRNGKRTTIWGMGRHNHENDVAIPGYDDLVVLSGDDSFITATPQSQLYSYIAKNTNSLLRDRGDLWAFRSTTAGNNSYLDVIPGEVIQGEFVKVSDKEIATGRDEDTGRDLLGADKGFGPPPADANQWQLNSFVPAAGRPGVDGPQWVLEAWGDSQNVFQFLRIEDIAYDKRPGMSNVIYLADSGRGNPSAPNGRIWRMVLNEDDPTKVDSLTILIEGDDNPLKTATEIHQPDNLETTASGKLLITEDPGSGNQFTASETGAHTARLWMYDLVAGGSPVVVASVDQGADGGATDVTPADPNPLAGATPLSPGRLGSWESSGIVDASSVLGAGWFFLTIQAHTLWVEKRTGDDNFTATGPGQDGVPDFTYKREGGQLIAIRVPGA